MKQLNRKFITPFTPIKSDQIIKSEKESIPVKGKLSSGLTAFQYVNEYKKDQARALRKDSTEAEKILWKRLRNRQVCGFKFRRQQPIEGFIADFFCEDALLVIEVDGGIHETCEQIEVDQRRVIVFETRGLLTLRLRNEEVINDVESCIREITRVLKLRCLKPHPPTRWRSRRYFAALRGLRPAKGGRNTPVFVS